MYVYIYKRMEPLREIDSIRDPYENKRKLLSIMEDILIDDYGWDAIHYIKGSNGKTDGIVFEIQEIKDISHFKYTLVINLKLSIIKQKRAHAIYCEYFIGTKYIEGNFVRFKRRTSSFPENTDPEQACSWLNDKIDKSVDEMEKDPKFKDWYYKVKLFHSKPERNENMNRQGLRNLIKECLEEIMDEGYGYGDPSKDPLRKGKDRWTLRWYSTKRKTPQLKEDEEDDPDYFSMDDPDSTLQRGKTNFPTGHGYPNVNRDIRKRLHLNDIVIDRDWNVVDVNDPKNYPVFVSLYDHIRAYGGPEEGGWWYDVYDLKGSVEVKNKIQAYKTAIKLFKQYAREADGQVEVYLEKEKGIFDSSNQPPPQYS